MSRNFELLRQIQQGSDPLAGGQLTGEVQQPVKQLPRPRIDLNTGTSDWLLALNVVKKHWRLSALFAIIVFSVVAVFTLLARSIYEPVARIQVDPPGAEVFTLQGNSGQANSGEYLETQAKNLQSDQLALQVIRDLHLQSNPEFVGKAQEGKTVGADSSNIAVQLTPAENSALRSLQADTTVTRDTASRLISVSVAAHDPTLAATITNTLVDLFIRREYQMRHDAIMQSSEWLARQLDDIRARMDESNRTLADFQKASGIAGLGDSQGTTFSEQMIEVNRQLMQAQADRIQLQSYLNRFNGQASSSLPQISSSPVVQGLTQKLAESRAALSQALAVYGKNHPNVKKLQNEVDELQTQLNAQRAAILADLKTTYNAAQAREHMMASQAQGTQRQMALVAQYNELKKEADANTQLYNTLYQKVKEAGIAAESKSTNIRVVDRARVLDSPTRPHRLRNMAFGLFAGILGGILFAFVREGLDTRIRTAEDVKKCLGAESVSVLPVIGDVGRGLSLIPHRSRDDLPPVFLLDRPHSPEAEALRGLYTSVRLSRRGGAPQVLLIASALPGEGKTTLSLNLGIALAQGGRTCVVDADLRKEGIASSLGITPEHGLSEVLSGEASLEQALVSISDVPNLTVLSTGANHGDPGALIGSDAMSGLVRRLRQSFDFVVIDSPPIVPFADGRALSVLVDGVILVGRAGVTTREQLTRAIEFLHSVRSAPIIDVVLNGVEYPSVHYRYYRYGHKASA